MEAQRLSGNATVVSSFNKTNGGVELRHFTSNVSYLTEKNGLIYFYTSFYFSTLLRRIQSETVKKNST